MNSGRNQAQRLARPAGGPYLSAQVRAGCRWIVVGGNNFPWLDVRNGRIWAVEH